MSSFFYMPIQKEFNLKYFELFTFVKILNHSPAQDLSNKKKCSFLRLLWAQIFLLLRQKAAVFFYSKELELENEIKF